MSKSAFFWQNEFYIQSSDRKSVAGISKHFAGTGILFNAGIFDDQGKIKMTLGRYSDERSAKKAVEDYFEQLNSNTEEELKQEPFFWKDDYYIRTVDGRIVAGISSSPRGNSILFEIILYNEIKDRVGGSQTSLGYYSTDKFAKAAIEKYFQEATTPAVPSDV